MAAKLLDVENMIKETDEASTKKDTKETIEFDEGLRLRNTVKTPTPILFSCDDARKKSLAYLSQFLTPKKVLGLTLVVTLLAASIYAAKHSLSKENYQKLVDFLMEPKAQLSLREKLYQGSDILAETYCTLSNIGLFAVGFYYKDYATIFAATASALSHAFPLQRLQNLDFLAIGVVGLKAILNSRVILANPSTILPAGALALSINLLDTYLSKRFGNYTETLGPIIHSIWHMAAAFGLHKFNQALKLEEKKKEAKLKIE